MTAILVGLIRIYQSVSRFLPPTCRYYPSCSEYGVQALRKHGPFVGIGLTVRRILRCHPFAPGGYDPVP